MKQWDAIVVGGGLAGSATAIHLAQAGRQVLLIERETQAHHKVCGEFISRETRQSLEGLGIDLAGLGAAVVDTVQLVRGTTQVSAPLPFQAMSLSRYRMDEALLDRAVACGVHLQRGETVRSVERVGSEWLVKTGDATSQAPNMVIASGKRDIPGLPRQSESKNNYIGFKMHWRFSTPPHALQRRVVMLWFSGGYAGLELVEGNTANLCLVVTKPRFAKLGKKWENLLAAWKEEAPLLAHYLRDAEPCWEQPLAAYAIPYGFIYPGSTNLPGLYRVGDQMAVIPSFSGDGMAIALDSASTAAQCILATHAEDYHRRMRRKLRPQIRIAMRMAAWTSNGFGQRLTVQLCRFFPGLLRRFIQDTRVKALNERFPAHALIPSLNPGAIFGGGASPGRP